MELTYFDIEGIRVIKVEGARIDVASAISFKDQMRELSENAPGRLILDLTTVEFLDSSGLGAVVGAMKQVGVERKLELAGLTETVRKVFRLTRMDTIFEIHLDVDSAINLGLANAS